MIELGGILNIGGFADDDGGAFFVSSDWEVKTSLFKHLYEVSCTECRVGYYIISVLTTEARDGSRKVVPALTSP